MTGSTNISQHITQNPEVMAGQPVIAGTRIPVERVLAHLAQKPDLADLFAAYPELTEDDAKACLRMESAGLTDSHRFAILP